MLRKIESLRKQPKQVRNRYAFWVALSVTAVITLVWVITLPDKISDFEVGVSDDTRNELSTFANVINDIKGNVVESFADLRDAGEEVATTTPSSTTQDFSVLLKATRTEETRVQQEVLIGTTSSASSTSE